MTRLPHPDQPAADRDPLVAHLAARLFRPDDAWLQASAASAGLALAAYRARILATAADLDARAAAVLRVSERHSDDPRPTQTDQLISTAYHATRPRTEWDVAAFERVYDRFGGGLLPGPDTLGVPSQHDYDVYRDWYDSLEGRRWLCGRVERARRLQERRLAEWLTREVQRLAERQAVCAAAGVDADALERFADWLSASNLAEPIDAAAIRAARALLAAVAAPAEPDAGTARR